MATTGSLTGAQARPAGAGPAPGARSGPVGGLRFLRRNHLAAVGLLLSALIVALAILAPWIAPYDFDDQDFARTMAPPAWLSGGSPANLLGTDSLGRDLLSRVIYGTRISLGLAGTAVIIAALAGVLLGLLAGFYGGKVDAVIMRLADIQLSFPYLLLAVAVMALLKPSLLNLIVVMVIRSWVAYARLVRVSTLSLRERDFVTAARSLGATDPRILLCHIAPNVVAPAVIVSTFQLAELIIVEASLSFLGLGVQPPTPSWGSMLRDGREYLATAWWLATFPGLAIILTALGTNMLGDSLRDYLDPRVRKL